ncbi:hypothetical protein PR202_ga14454 [Eleusine coracana subsp. coracana]|uniref:glutathione transferase n=1 Tax=Eleusine coracana subsp. coracana TaxID=191504 RepID=A0AAV5CGK7_ELECO|nr:hypothetical protein PR202_ga14454 [Eleusine coracana subsp. coracana]
MAQQQQPPAVKLMSAFGSPFAHRVEVALALKGVPYELVLEDLANKSEMLLKHNPIHKSVPVLLHGDRPAICESLTIVEYVEDAFGDDGSAPRLLPAVPYERATARFWAHFIDTKILGPLWMSLWTDGEAHERFSKETKENLAILDAQLDDGNKRFFGGDALGIVDVAGCTLAQWLDPMQEAAGVRVVADDEFPALRRWAKEYTSHEVVKRSLPDQDQLVAFFAANKERFTSMVRDVLQQ